MVKFKFWVQCDGWKAGGYENAHFAENEKEAKKIVKRWNDERDEIAAFLGHPVDGYVTLLEVKEISVREFAEDCTYL